MSIMMKKGKPKILVGVEIRSIGGDEKIVVMELMDIKKRRTTVALPPDVAFSMLEDLSITTLGLSKKGKKDSEIMYR